MGQSRTTEQTRPEATPEERRLNQLDIQLREAIQPGLIDVQQQGLSLASLLLGGQQLPGGLQGLTGGLSEDVISDISRKAVSDISPGLQAQGILESGVGASVQGRVAGDIRRQAAEFNIGNQLNLLNLALSGQAQVQAPGLGVGSTLGGRLAGLRSITQTTQQPNVFAQQFLGGLGQGIGQAGFSFGGGGGGA